MLQFLQPTWLWLSAGIIVPVIIHLWNVKQGKTLRVGSIAFFNESAQAHAKSIKLSDLILLLLRCLLLILLAMLIAKPYLLKSTINSEKGWFLIKKDQVQEVYPQYKVTIDSLIQAGYTFHYFESGFPQAAFNEVVSKPGNKNSEAQRSHWSLLKELEQGVPAKFPVYVFTDNLAKNFTGSRPTLSLHLIWNIYNLTDTTATWIEKAYITNNDSIRLVTGKSTATGIHFIHQALTSNTISQFKIENNNGKIVVVANDSSAYTNQEIEVDTSTTIITIFTKKSTTDVTYLRAAILAIKDFTKHKIRVASVNTIHDIPSNFNWLFWLSEEPMPSAFIKNNVFIYERGRIENQRSSFIAGELQDAALTEDISIFKYVRHNISGESKPETIWRNDFGKPLLTRERKAGTIYQFYSRFNPQWNSLTWSNKFPQIIYSLLFEQTWNQNKWIEGDRRILDGDQIQPIVSVDTGVVERKNLADKKDVSNIFWLVILVLFFLERWLSFKLKKEEVYG